MPFSRFVEIGRVALVNYGPSLGKLCVILDVLDQNRVFVHGPTTGVPRHTISIRRLALTELVVKVSRGARSKALTKAWKTAGVEAKWGATAWAKKIALKNKRANSTDFERFKLTAARRTRASAAGKTLKALMKAKAK